MIDICTESQMPIMIECHEMYKFSANRPLANSFDKKKMCFFFYYTEYMKKSEIVCDKKK